jgi:hypothetical protein
MYRDRCGKNIQLVVKEWLYAVKQKYGGGADILVTL